MITKIYGGNKPLVHLYFSTGNMLSIIWGPGSYTENHDKWWEIGDDHHTYESTTVEIMASGSKEFERWFKRRFNGNPGAYIPVKKLPAIIERADLAPSSGHKPSGVKKNG